MVDNSILLLGPKKQLAYENNAAVLSVYQTYKWTEKPQCVFGVFSANIGIRKLSTSKEILQPCERTIFFDCQWKSCEGSSSPWQGTPSFLQKPITASTNTLSSSCGIDIYLKIRQRQSNKRCKKGMVPIPSVQL